MKEKIKEFFWRIFKVFYIAWFALSGVFVFLGDKYPAIEPFARGAAAGACFILVWRALDRWVLKK